MKILDPQSGKTIDTDTWDQTNLAILPNMREAQVRMLRRLELPRPAELLDAEWDDELGQMVPTIHAGDPGDER